MIKPRRDFILSLIQYRDYVFVRIGYGFQQDLRNIKKEDEESSSKMITDMERLLESGTLTDVTIKCENRILECHKVGWFF